MKMQFSRPLLLSTIAVIAFFLAAFSGAAKAGTVAFTYTAAGLSASGSFDLSQLSSGVCEATSGSLTISTAPVASMVGLWNLLANSSAPATTNSPSGAFTFNDVVYDPPVSSGYLDIYGLLFTSGGAEFNIWGNSGPNTYSGWRYASDTGFNYSDNQGNFALVPTPAAASMGLVLVVGLGSVDLLQKRKTLQVV